MRGFSTDSARRRRIFDIYCMKVLDYSCLQLTFSSALVVETIE
ncbi:MAG: hypothetical protein WAV28_18690 [Sedimentisphaerales bacterium]